MVTAPDSHGQADASTASAKIATARRSGMRAAARAAAAADPPPPASQEFSESSSATGAGGSFLRSIPSPGLMQCRRWAAPYSGPARHNQRQAAARPPGTSTPDHDNMHDLRRFMVP